MYKSRVDLFSLLDFFFQAEDGIRDLVRSRGLGDVYKRQANDRAAYLEVTAEKVPDQQEQLADAQSHEHFTMTLSLIHI